MDLWAYDWIRTDKKNKSFQNKKIPNIVSKNVHILRLYAYGPSSEIKY